MIASHEDGDERNKRNPLRRLSQEHLRRFAWRRAPSPRRSRAQKKVDAAEQFKVGKTVMERAAEDAGVESVGGHK